MDEDDPHGFFDPIWYDRAERDAPPGLILNAAAYLFLWVMAGLVMAVRVYWLPDRLWCRVSGVVARYKAHGLKGF